MREICADLYEELLWLNNRIKTYDLKIKLIAKENRICRRLMTIPGIGEISATILLTVLGDPSLFKNGRHFAAFLGLVPKQSSSGGRQRLLGISKRGDDYIRSLLIHGGRSVLRTVGTKDGNRSRWIKQLNERAGHNRTAVAIANKNARVVWSIVKNEMEYQEAV
jgi:transposase